MPAGLQITNASNQLVFTTDAPMYRYWGTPTLVQTSTIPYRYIDNNVGAAMMIIDPWKYQFTLPDPAMIPLVGFGVNTTTVIDMPTAPMRLSGSTWEVEIYCVDGGNATDWWSYGGYHPASVQVANPAGVYVFCPYGNTDVGQANSGLELFDQNGNLTFSTRWKPFWLRQAIPFPSELTELQQMTGPVVDRVVSGIPQVASTTLISNPIVMNSAAGYYQKTVSWEGGTTEDAAHFGSFGWQVNGEGKLQRRNYTRVGTHRYGDALYWTSEMADIVALVADGSLL